MIIALIFFLHIIFIVYVFIKKWKYFSISEVVIDLVFVIVFFSIGWSLTTMGCKLLFDPSGLGEYFDRDTIALLLLTVLEMFFYRIYFRELFSISNEMEK